MVCKLCLQEKDLCNSHIIPEFFYEREELYDDKHRYLRLSLDPTQQDTPQQKGQREYLLCGSCEDLFNHQYERYGRRVLYDKRHRYSTMTPDAEILNDVDYGRFKLFQLSILWRASISSLPEFSDVNLGQHDERIREMLLSGDPGTPYEYGCLMLDPSTEPDPATGLQVEHSAVSVSKPIEVLGYTHVLFMFGGLYWLYIVSEQLQEFPAKDKLLTPEEKKLIISKVTSNSAKASLDKEIFEMRAIEEQRRKLRKSS